MNKLENYAKLLIHNGINVQKGQEVNIKAQVNIAGFVRLCVKEAYEAGAGVVRVDWKDDAVTRMRYEYCDVDHFKEFESWIADRYNSLAEKKGAFLSISSGDPEILKGIDTAKISAYDKVSSDALDPFYERMMSGKLSWCVASMPSPAWAAKVFPDLSEEEGMDRLLNAILTASRADRKDPVAAWDEQQSLFDRRLEVLNAASLVSLRYTNSIGTDLTVGLPDNHVWFGGSDDHAEDDYKFLANIPTEEIFTAPDRNRADGIVYSSMPLAHMGQIIDDFWFRFKDGQVVEFGAAKGEALLKEVFDNDPDANRLGEVALVPFDSPISNMNLLFYNTLFDENASCHLAIGSAYPTCVEGGDQMTKDERLEANINVAKTHIDFMIGTSDLKITGVREDGTEMKIFEDGNFVF